jgi:hypothetical protein
MLTALVTFGLEAVFQRRNPSERFAWEPGAEH